MRKISLIFLIAVCAFFSTAVLAQPGKEKAEPRVIEVTGSAETLITPNEFTFKITLLERIEKKEKITIELQEKALREGLAKIGIDAQKDLTIFDLSSSYISRRKLRDTLASKDYRLKLNDLEKIGKLQDLADDLNISNLELIEATHSELTRLRRETKMEALKAAKAKAEYMLGAIGEKIGNAAFIQEINAENARYGYALPNITSNSISNGRSVSVGAEEDTSLTFTKIKLRYEVLARFEIQ